MPTLRTSPFPIGVLLAIAIWSATAAAANPTGNGITIRSISGGAQANRPVTVSRVFAQGEFPKGAYPQAKIGGAVVPTQVDLKNTWADGSVRHALVSFAANIPKTGKVSVEFVAQPTTNNEGYLDKASMLDYNGGAWGARIEATNGSTLAADARAMLAAWDGRDTGPNGLGVRYWMKGPVVTQVIVEDRSPALQFDFGWDTHKPLHPIFVLSFYPGSGLGVKVEHILENAWTTKLEDQSYSLTLRTGNPPGDTVYRKDTFTHAAATRWRKVFWSGAAPVGWTDQGHPGININYNPAYLTASKAIPNYDLTKTPPSSALSDDVNHFKASDRGDINGFALWTQSMPTSGGRADLGVIPAWYVRYLYSMDPGMYAVLIGMAEVSGYVPFHFRESARPERKYSPRRPSSAFGRPISIDARPTVYVPKLSYEGQQLADTIRPVGKMSSNGWEIDLAHQPAFTYVPYLITGDWYFLEELYFLAARDLASGEPSTVSYGRHGSWGYFNDQDVQTRGQAWGRRDIAEAGFAAPDDSPEKAYFTEKVNNNLAIEEGYMNNAGGAFYMPCTTEPYQEATEQSKWCWGRKSAGRNWPNPLHFGSMGHSDDVLVRDPDIAPPSDPNAPLQADQPWMTLYKLNVAGHVQELGYDAAGANRPAFQHLINMLANPDFNPYLCGAYMGGVVSKRGIFYQTWGELLLSYNPAFQGRINLRTVNRWWDTTSDDTAADGYPHLCQAAASYLPGLSDGPYTGAAAWKWTVDHISSAPLNSNPQYAVVPR